MLHLTEQTKHNFQADTDFKRLSQSESKHQFEKSSKTFVKGSLPKNSYKLIRQYVIQL